MQRTFDVSGPVQLDIRLASGDIVVDPTLEGRVEVELTANDEESQALVDNARIEQHDGHVLVDVPHKRGGGFNFSFIFGRSGISCRVRCPASSSVEVRSKSADVEALGALQDLAVHTASGDVGAETVGGALTVRSASGDVRVRHVGGEASVQTASGDVELGFVGGRANLNAVSGDVRIGRAMADASVRTVSGDQHHEGVGTGNVTANSVSGDVLVAVKRGTRVFLDCNTVSGDTSSDLDMTGEPAGSDSEIDGPLIEIRAKTVSGDIRITRAHHFPDAPADDSAQEVHA